MIESLLIETGYLRAGVSFERAVQTFQRENGTSNLLLMRHPPRIKTLGAVIALERAS